MVPPDQVRAKHFIIRYSLFDIRYSLPYRVWPGNWRVVQLLPGAHVRVVALGDESLPPEELPMA